MPDVCCGHSGISKETLASCPWEESEKGIDPRRFCLKDDLTPVVVQLGFSEGSNASKSKVLPGAGGSHL
jgi:hypothetical protein